MGAGLILTVTSVILQTAWHGGVDNPGVTGSDSGDTQPRGRVSRRERGPEPPSGFLAGVGKGLEIPKSRKQRTQGDVSPRGGFEEGHSGGFRNSVLFFFFSLGGR